MADAPVTDRRTTTTRLTALSVTVVVVLCALAVAFWYFQVVENAAYVRLAENNHVRRLALRAPRGVLFDRDGTLLVENREAFTISILREHSGRLDDTIRRLAAVNAAVGVLLFYLIEFMPTAREQWNALLERRRKRRYH